MDIATKAVFLHFEFRKVPPRLDDGTILVGHLFLQGVQMKCGLSYHAFSILHRGRFSRPDGGLAGGRVLKFQTDLEVAHKSNGISETKRSEETTYLSTC